MYLENYQKQAPVHVKGLQDDYCLFYVNSGCFDNETMNPSKDIVIIYLLLIRCNLCMKSILLRCMGLFVSKDIYDKPNQ